MQPRSNEMQDGKTLLNMLPLIQMASLGNLELDGGD